MNLHRAESADWNKLPSSQRNWWQQVAVRTGGIVTPANFISVLGGALVVIGLYAILQGELATGLFVIFCGRCADILDGMVAERTHTKSPVGEAFDAAIDKVVIGLTLIVLLTQGLLPLVIGLVMATHAFYNTSLTAVASRRKVKIHPVATGKYSALFEWSSVSLFLVAAVIENHSNLAADLSLMAATIAFIVFAWLAAISSLDYTRQLTKGPRA